MIVKLIKTGGIARCIECDEVLMQPLDGGNMDIEVVGKLGTQRFVISGDEWTRAYVMDGGVTIDMIQAEHRSLVALT